MTFISHFRNLLSLYDRKLRIVLVAGTLLLTVMAALEAVSIGAILPLAQLLATDEITPAQGYLYDLAVWIGVTDSMHLVLIGISGLVLLIACKGALSMCALHWTTREAILGRNRYAANAFDAFLSAPFAWLHHQNVMSILRHLNASSSQVFATGLPALVSLVSESALALFVAGLLVYVSPVSAAICLVVGGLASILLSRTIAKPTDRFAAERYDLAVTVNKHVAESMFGVQDIRTLGREALASQTHRAMLNGLGRATYMKTTIGLAPRYVFEVLAGGLILAVLIYLSMTHDRSDIIPTLGLFGVAAMRLLPTMARIVTSINSLREVFPSTQDALNHVDEFGAWLIGRAPAPAAFAMPERRLSLKEQIELRNVSFAYEDGTPVIRHVSMTIRQGETIGIVGPSGSGKSTLIGLLLGLYAPTSGEILVDGKPLDTSMSAYERSTGFVPQMVFLADNTIEHNVALGLPKEQVDAGRVRSALAMAQLLDFVDGLPEGAQTQIGENGVRLSGGQRQRLGIARALYDQPDVLILDEATSSLDLETEAEITRVTQSLRGRNTVVIVAHRLSTIRDCDTIFMLENGTIAAEGAFEVLKSQDQRFRTLVALGNLNG